MRTNIFGKAFPKISIGRKYSYPKGIRLVIPLLFFMPFIGIAQPSPPNDTLIIYFDHDKTEIHRTYEEPLKNIKKKLFNTPNKILLIHGFADHTGTDEYNQNLSQRRAAAVVSYLQNLEVPESLIESIRGKGSVNRSLPPNQRVPKDRKVMIVLANRSKPLVFKDFKLSKLNKGDKLVIDRLHFQPGKHILLRESIPRLKMLLQVLQTHPSLEIELQGHVCCAPPGRDGIDEDTKEERLSINRAHNIYQYLVRNGIDSNRLSYKGFARSQPLYPLERNEEERKMNRRVEIEIIDY
jgi:outer membrane protein OmpA-like peptidoglycan-associated protein